MAFKAMMKRSVSMARGTREDIDEDGLGSISASPTLRRSDSKRDSNNGGLEATSALDRFATLKDKLKLVRIRSNNGKMNRIGSNRIGDLVEEARLNRSAVIDDLGISASELKNQMIVSQNQKRATQYREIQEYGRRVPIPLPPDLLTLPRLAAWHYCIRHLELVEMSDGQTIISKGTEGRYVFFLLTGGVMVDGENDETLPLSILGEEALSSIPYTSTITASAEKNQSTFCARLSVAAYTEGLKEAEACRNSRSRQLRSLLLTSRTERTPVNIRDLSSQLAIIEIFRTMEPEVRLDLCSFIEALSVPAGATLFKEGDKICFCYVILQGTVVFTRTNPDTGMSEEIGVKLAGEHFGALSTLSNADRKRAFTATARDDCSFAIISRVGYSRITRNQIQNDMDARSDLIKGMNLFSGGSKFDNKDQAINRIAFNSSREDFPSGHVLVNPHCYQNKIYIIMEGSCRLVWQTENPLEPPPIPMTLEQHMAIYHPGQTVKKSPAELASKDQDLSPRRSKKSPRGGDQKGWRESKGYDGNTKTGAARDDNDIAQQMGILAGARTCGCGITLSSLITTSSLNPPSGSRGKPTSLDLAHLGRGDLINGDVLLGMAPALTVVASSSIKVMSMEVDAVESNPAFSSALQSMVRQQWELNAKRLRDTAGVRSALKVGTSAFHRNIGDNHEIQSKFLEHYVPNQKSSPSPNPGPSQPSASSPKARASPSTSNQHNVDLLRPQAASSLGFNEVCAVPLSTVHTRASIDGLGKAEHDPKRKQAQSAMAILQNTAAASSSSKPSEDPSAQVTSQGKVWKRAPNSLAPSTFSGHMHPLIGDLMGHDSNSNQVEGQRHRLANPPLNLTDSDEGLMQARRPDPLAPYEASGGSEAEAASPPNPYRPQFTLPNAFAKSRSPSPMLSSGSTMMDSPVLMSKVAKLRPVNSRATAAFASKREAAIVSVGRLSNIDPLSLPSLGAAPSTPPQGASRSQGGEDVAILPHHTSSYAALLPLRESSPSPSHSPKKVIRSKLGLPPPEKPKQISQVESPLKSQNSGLLSRQSSMASAGSGGGWEERSVNKNPNPGGPGMFERLSSKRDMMAFGSYQDTAQGCAGGSESFSKGPSSMSRMGTNQRSSLRANGSVRDQPGGASFKVRSIKAWRRPDEDLDLPLDRDALAPTLKDHPVSAPSIADINYILRRWDNQWESDRQEARRKLKEERARSRLDEEEDDEHEFEDHGGALWDLDQFGAPTFSPGL